MALFDGAIRRAIHAFKYRHVAALGEPLGNILAEFWQQVAWPVDLIVPVPLHSHRQRERGYNQAALLAQGLVRAAHLPLRANALQRVRATASQMTLDAAQRRSNVNAAFRSDDNGLRGKRVLLVDDVCTTGATLNACAVALKSAGAVEVWGLTLARTA